VTYLPCLRYVSDLKIANKLKIEVQNLIKDKRQFLGERHDIKLLFLGKLQLLILRLGNEFIITANLGFSEMS